MREQTFLYDTKMDVDGHQAHEALILRASLDYPGLFLQ